MPHPRPSLSAAHCAGKLLKQTNLSNQPCRSLTCDDPDEQIWYSTGDQGQVTNITFSPGSEYIDTTDLNATFTCILTLDHTAANGTDFTGNTSVIVRWVHIV